MKLGLSSYTYPWAVGVGDQIPVRRMTAMDVLQRADAMGVRVVQFADGIALHELPEPELAELERAAGALGIQIEVGLRAITPEPILAYIGLAARFGSPIVRIVMRTGKRMGTEAEYAVVIQAVLPELERAGVTLAIETHESLRAAALRRIVEAAGSERIGVCFDTANSLGCFETAEMVLAEIGRHVVNFHIKDVSARRISHGLGLVIDGTPAGAGGLDIPALIASVRAVARPDTNAILEHWVPNEASLEATLAKEERWARESVAYLRQFLKD